MHECRGEIAAGRLSGGATTEACLRSLASRRWSDESKVVWFVCGGAATSSVTKKDDGRLAEAITVEWMGG